MREWRTTSPSRRRGCRLRRCSSRRLRRPCSRGRRATTRAPPPRTPPCRGLGRITARVAPSGRSSPCSRRCWCSRRCPASSAACAARRPRAPTSSTTAPGLPAGGAGGGPGLAGSSGGISRRSTRPSSGRHFLLLLHCRRCRSREVLLLTISCWTIRLLMALFLLPSRFRLTE